MTLRGHHGNFSLFLPEPDATPDKFASALVLFEAVFVQIAYWSAAYYRNVLADLTVEIENCYSKITDVACFDLA